MVSQCCKCYRVKVKNGGWLHIGPPEMAHEILTTDGIHIEISHGFCPECYHTAKARIASDRLSLLLDTTPQAA